MQKKLPFYSSVLGPSFMTHIKRQKLISSTQAVNIIRTVYYIHGPELIKLIFAVLYDLTKVTFLQF